LRTETDLHSTAEIEKLTQRVVRDFRAMLRGSPLDGLGPIELARKLRIDKTLASRVLTALRTRDALAALSSLPGTVPLRQFVRAARAHGATVAAAQAAEQAVAEFERGLQRSFGTRTRLDAVLSDCMPLTRRKHLETARQSVYRGMAFIRGVSFDLSSTTWIVHPSTRDPAKVDIQVVAAFAGIRRIRPSARVQLVSTHAGSPPEADAAIVREFCEPQGLSVEVTREGKLTLYEIASLPVARDAAADIVLSEMLPAAADRDRPAGKGTIGYGDVVAHASRRLLMNIVVHRDAWPGCDFSLHAYDNAGRGFAAPGPLLWSADRLDLEAPVTRSDVTPAVLRSSPVPRYHELLTHITGPLGWNLAEFRQFSCEIVYPIYGSHVTLMSVGA
jgi:hypothetical protein